MEVLLVNTVEAALPAWAGDLVRGAGWNATEVSDYQSAMDAARDRTLDALLLTEPPDRGETSHNGEFPQTYPPQ